ncbi:hypothetical protein GNIT_2550 [Glaciecola nitratireducens FR1064]|uniref:Uncharacterized protein n=1 Tax=Glaciecola nitratireducens (strain JCM 12485 / KCTC 12276 / FR1064) TaxID=1085623 RepID=G4QM76_GLANF|nr:hypothetical protein GNIT_2550 [Glaciecola nitratireducens FR1064]
MGKVITWKHLVLGNFGFLGFIVFFRLVFSCFRRFAKSSKKSPIP